MDDVVALFSGMYGGSGMDVFRTRDVGTRAPAGEVGDVGAELRELVRGDAVVRGTTIGSSALVEVLETEGIVEGTEESIADIEKSKPGNED